jgi:hypothetical protein
MSDINKHLEKLLDEVLSGRSEHLEMFAAAYFKRTGIDPRHALLVEQRSRDGSTIRWWFEDKPLPPKTCCREAEEIIRRLDVWIFNRGAKGVDYACAECVPDGEMTKTGFICAFHTMKKFLADRAGKKGEGV